jgi:hypothetical protein
VVLIGGIPQWSGQTFLTLMMLQDRRVRYDKIRDRPLEQSILLDFVCGCDRDSVFRQAVKTKKPDANLRERRGKHRA